MRSIDGRTVLITGASRGLGVTMAERFAAQGARVALAARSVGDLETVRKRIEALGGTAVTVATDVGDLDSLRHLVTSVEEALGPIDVLVNNAGIEHVWDFEDESFDTIEQIVRVNVIGLLWLTRLIVPSMVERGTGHVVNIASLAGLAPVPHNAVYCATKHAVVGATRALRIELGEHGVEVSVVCPGFVDGGMFVEWGRPAPRLTGSVSAEQVADAVLRAVTRNKGEVVVTKGLARIGDWVEAVAPETSARFMRATGMVGYLRDQAQLNREKAAR